MKPVSKPAGKSIKVPLELVPVVKSAIQVWRQEQDIDSAMADVRRLNRQILDSLPDTSHG